MVARRRLPVTGRRPREVAVVDVADGRPRGNERGECVDA
jgi:hypothetical protein